jgi:hypothetical protein
MDSGQGVMTTPPEMRRRAARMSARVTTAGLISTDWPGRRIAQALERPGGDFSVEK